VPLDSSRKVIFSLSLATRRDVHLVDGRDLFVSILRATCLPCPSLATAPHRSPRMTFFARAAVLLPYSSFCLRPWGQKSQVPASCAGWPVSRSGKLSFISLTNSDGPLSFLCAALHRPQSLPRAARRAPLRRKSASGREKK
jgi:hypothetical protein